MTAHIINLDEHRVPPNPGNGAREALIEMISIEELADSILTGFWLRGFKVVPLASDD